MKHDKTDVFELFAEEVLNGQKPFIDPTLFDSKSPQIFYQHKDGAL